MASSRAARTDPLALAAGGTGVDVNGALVHATQKLDRLPVLFGFAQSDRRCVVNHELRSCRSPIRCYVILFSLRRGSGSLAEAHDAGLIHRDIKPANIMVTCRGGVPDFTKVLDFGLAKEAESSHAPTVTVADAIAGTPLYFSPEATKGSMDLDQRSDIYSLGIVAYEMLAGRPPFEGDSAIDVCLKHAATPAPPLSHVARQPIPAELEAIIMQCLEKCPTDRPQSAHELCRRLVAVSSCRLMGWAREDAMKWWSRRSSSTPDDAETKVLDPIRVVE